MTAGSPDGVPVLNGPQRRHLEVVLSSLQRALHEVEQLAGSQDDGHGDLTVFDRDLPADFSGRLRSGVKSVRASIARIIELLGIEPRHRSRAAAVRAAITSAIIRLEDTHSYKMRGYGPVDPSVAKHLDPLVDELIAEFRGMQRLSDEARGAARTVKPRTSET